MSLIEQFFALHNKAKAIVEDTVTDTRAFVFFIDEDIDERWDEIQSECQTFSYINKYNESDTYYIKELYRDEEGVFVKGVTSEGDTLDLSVGGIDTEALIHLADLIDGRSPEDFNGLPPSAEEEEAEADEVGEL